MSSFGWCAATTLAKWAPRPPGVTPVMRIVFPAMYDESAAAASSAGVVASKFGFEVMDVDMTEAQSMHQCMCKAVYILLEPWLIVPGVAYSERYSTRVTSPTC